MGKKGKYRGVVWQVYYSTILIVDVLVILKSNYEE
jgi:hypothetical protein